MGNIWAITKRELASYFNSLVAYVILCAFLLLAGYLFFTQLFTSREADLRGFFAMAPLLFAIFCPAITMKLLAEERATGTFELLITNPVRDWEVVLGKFLGAFLLLVSLIVLTFTYPLTVSHYGHMEWGPVIGGYLGLMFMGAAYLAIGLMVSSWVRSQIAAFMLGLFFCFALFLAGKLLQVLPQSIAPIIQYLSLDFHFQNIS